MYLSLKAITIAYKVILVDITKKETILINSIYQLIHTTYAMINILYKYILQTKMYPTKITTYHRKWRNYYNDP